MPRISYNDERTRIEKEIQKLQKEINNLQQRERKPVLQSIVRSMNEYDISIEEVATALEKGVRGGARKRSVLGNRPAVQPKYQDPKSGATWSGRGKAPRWMVAADQAGVPRDEFLINK